MEAAVQNSKALQLSDGEPSSVKKVSTVPRRNTKPASATPLKPCYWCGQADQHSKCPHKEATCHFCHKKGHLLRVCLSKPRQARGSVGKAKSPPQRAHAVTAAERESSPGELQLFHIGHKQSKTKPLLCTLTIEGKPVEMEIDTGADVSIMAERTYQQLFSHKPLQPSTVRLTTYTQSPIQVKGQLPVQVYYGQQTFELTLIVVAGSGPSLLGRNWLHSIRLDWRAIHKASSALLTPLSSLLDQHQALFQDELGTIEKEKATLLSGLTARPSFSSQGQSPTPSMTQ